MARTTKKSRAKAPAKPKTSSKGGPSATGGPRPAPPTGGSAQDKRVRALTAPVDEFLTPVGKRSLDLAQRPKPSTKKSTKAAPTPKHAAARRSHAKRLEAAREAERVPEITFEFSATPQIDIEALFDHAKQGSLDRVLFVPSPSVDDPLAVLELRRDDRLGHRQ